MSALLSPYELLTSLETVRRVFIKALHFIKDMNLNKLQENFELLVLVSIFISTVYAVAPAV